MHEHQKNLSSTNEELPVIGLHQPRTIIAGTIALLFLLGLHYLAHLSTIPAIIVSSLVFLCVWQGFIPKKPKKSRKKGGEEKE